MCTCMIVPSIKLAAAPIVSFMFELRPPPRERSLTFKTSVFRFRRPLTPRPLVCGDVRGVDGVKDRAVLGRFGPVWTRPVSLRLKN